MTLLMCILVVACIGAMAAGFLAAGRLDKSVGELEERFKALDERDAQKKGVEK